MSKITLLDQNTIDKIAAGEVIERPASVVKELVENSIDAGASAITVEIKEGGISFIRITDNGTGIIKDEVPLAFLRHSTSKIHSVEDLVTVSSLGFRGEALSSIAAVSQVELITKTAKELTGLRYVIEGGMEKSKEDIGAPEGTTFIVRNLFYNTPARRKFLKSATTETGYINELMIRLSMSHPGVSLKFISNNQIKLHTSGNSNLKDIIYHVYGREIANHIIPIEYSTNHIKIDGYIGKPLISRGNRNYENYYVNGRYVKSKIVTAAIEEAYKTFMMQHKYPFTALHFTIDGEFLDVNVHPTKMELRFMNQEETYQSIFEIIKDSLTQKELIPEIKLVKESEKEKEQNLKSVPEPFEKNRIHKLLKESSDYATEKIQYVKEKQEQNPNPYENKNQIQNNNLYQNQKKVTEQPVEKKQVTGEQMDLFEEKLLSKASKKEHRLIGQVFDTYWLVQFKDNLFIIDQHAAHEKVLYERIMNSLKTREYTSQIISPPIILTLTMQEEELLKKYMDNFLEIGFEIEPFGGREYSVRAVPDNLFGIAKKELLLQMIDGLSEEVGNKSPDLMNEKIASMSCKAAVKGKQTMSFAEVDALIDELLELKNPYNCPHGRPTIVSMSNYELEKKFKRII